MAVVHNKNQTGTLVVLSKNSNKNKFRTELTLYPKEMLDFPPGGACIFTVVWAFSSEFTPWPLMISLVFRGGGLACTFGSSKTVDFCRASWWGFTKWGFLGSGSNDGLGTGWGGSPNTLDCWRLCWLCLWCAGAASATGASLAKTFDLLRATWHWLTSLCVATGVGSPSLPNKLIEVFPPGGASTL